MSGCIAGKCIDCGKQLRDYRSTRCRHCSGIAVGKTRISKHEANPLDKKWLISEYTTKKKSALQICKENNLDYKYLSYWINKHNISKSTYKYKSSVPISVATRRKIGVKSKANWQKPKYRKRMMGVLTEQHQSEKRKKAVSKASKKLWENPDFRAKITASWDVSPNKCEIQIIQILESFKSNFKFVGDYSFWIKRFNPDFIDYKAKKIIEFFGDYWHKDSVENDKDRVDTYKKAGYHTLVIWEHELQELDKVKTKIKEFVCQETVTI